ncbi:MAG: asparagine synthetase B, partial [Methanobacteriota archaeon]
MCGIFGILPLSGALKPGNDFSEAVASMSHRGPDDYGSWKDDNWPIALGHRRLSIVDLSPAGHQPMHSPSGRYVIVYNGEIYLHNELRAELSRCGFSFRGNSDTEVMLAAIETWGLEHALERFVGMFAFALWDKETCTLHLVRDRLGIKPLYYLYENGLFAFASEPKAFFALPDWSPSLDRDAAKGMLRHGYIIG